MNRHFFVVPGESGSTADLVFGVGGRTLSSTSAGTMVLPAVERGSRRRAWRSALQTLAVAALPLVEVYNPPTRRLLETGVSHILVLGEDVDDDLLVETESLLVVVPERSTLWFPGPLPILAPRRPYVPPTWDLFDDDE